MKSLPSAKYYRSLSLKEKAALYASLIREPGWELLRRTYQPEIRTRIIDTNTKESFIYEAIRSQVIQEIFSLPEQVISKINSERIYRPAQTLTEPMPPIDAED